MSLPRRLFVLSCAAAAITTRSYAATAATPDEAKALAEKAAAHFKEVGAEKAIADFAAASGDFADRDMFVVVYGPTNKVECAAGVPVLVGKDATLLKDSDGKEFGKEIIALGKTQGTGWVDYRMTNPLTKKIGLKRSWVVGLGEYVLFVGAFG